MKKIYSGKIIAGLADLAIETNRILPDKIKRSIVRAYKTEPQGPGKKYLKAILENINTAQKEKLPLCQDTGIAILFVEIGDEVKIDKGHYKNLEDIFNEGIRQGYEKGFLRKSVVSPITRKPSGTNIPAIIHFFPAAGDIFRIRLLVKGFGSENNCALQMLNPSDGKEGVEDFVINKISSSGANSCPPLFLGIGIGGSFEKAAILSKQALCEIGETSSSSNLRKWERSLIKKINSLQIGPGGFGGNTTVLDLKIKTFPTHIAGLPAALTICCWAHRTGVLEL